MTTEKHLKYMDEARDLGQRWGKDRSTKIGAIIIGEGEIRLSTGWNGFPRGINDDVEERHARPAKYAWTEHAERNAIYNAARAGISLLGGRLYVTELAPCVDCARAIIQSGIKEIFIEDKPFKRESLPGKNWLDEWPMTYEMLMEAGIKVTGLNTYVNTESPQEQNESPTVART